MVWGVERFCFTGDFSYFKSWVLLRGCTSIELQGRPDKKAPKTGSSGQLWVQDGSMAAWLSWWNLALCSTTDHSTDNFFMSSFSCIVTNWPIPSLSLHVFPLSLSFCFLLISASLQLSQWLQWCLSSASGCSGASAQPPVPDDVSVAQLSLLCPPTVHPAGSLGMGTLLSSAHLRSC